MATVVSYVPTFSNKTSINKLKKESLKTRLPLPVPHKLRPTPLPKKRHLTSLPLNRPDHRALTERELCHLVSTIVRLPVGETITPVLAKCQGHVTQSIFLQLVQDLGRQGYTLRAAEVAVWAQGQLRVRLDARILAELASALRASGHVDIADIIYRPNYGCPTACASSTHADFPRLSTSQVNDSGPVNRLEPSTPSVANTPSVHKAHDSNHVPRFQGRINSIAPTRSPHVSSPSTTSADSDAEREDNIRRPVPTYLQQPFLAQKKTLVPPRTPLDPSRPKLVSDNKASCKSNSLPFLGSDPSLSAGVQGPDSHSSPLKTEATAAPTFEHIEPVSAVDIISKSGTMFVEGGCDKVEFSEGGERERKHSLLEWTSVISGLAKSGQLGEARVTYMQMLREGGKPDPVLYRLMMQVYAKLEDVDRAEKIMRQMRTLGFMPSLAEYNILIALHCAMSCPQKAVKVLEAMMRDGVAPITQTFNLIARGFKDAGDCEEALRILRMMGGPGAKSDSGSYELLLKIYATQRCFKEFDAVMEEMQANRFRLRPGAAAEIRSLYYEASKATM